jgi:hypothetical protein
MHFWFEQRSPAGHAAPPPQVHVPPEHPSADAPQSEHDAPAAPQVLEPREVQTFPEQQPLGHEVASQTQLPWKQCWPETHAAAPLHVH